MLEPTAHLDTFARDNLPPRDSWPAMSFDRPELRYPERLNAAVELLDGNVALGNGPRPCLWFGGKMWSYADLLERSNRIANVLVREFDLKPGNRVLLRSANNPMMVACWFAVLKAGGIAVATMPLLRARELGYILRKARIDLSLCDARLADELAAAGARDLIAFNSDASEGLEARMARQPASFANCDTHAHDMALIAFTSGTTGPAKGTMHFHRDVMAICDCFPRSVLKPSVDDVF
ncbi:MAG: AMP-binding protein, partial [Alphaproteobacteria bacterium]|nr:AMP-binding protein [Alphaproteobacteria bacterium]